MLSFECIKWSIQGVQYPWSCQFNIPRNFVPILLWENSSKDVSQSQLEWKWWRMWDQGHKRLDSQEPNSVTNGFESTPASLPNYDGFRWLLLQRVNTFLSSQRWWILASPDAPLASPTAFGFAAASKSPGNPIRWQLWQETRTRHKRKCHDNGR